tara:strand:- start:224677 stop:225114 length:438 start_codon:yes stop_codon:yes gene_type:complete
MEHKQSVKPPTWFWIVSVLALIWNLMGVGQYLAQAFITNEAKALMTAEQLKLLEETPSWLTAIFAIAVWAGLIACIGLLMRKKWAQSVFLISLLAVIIQMGYSTFMTNAGDVYGTTALVMALVVTSIAVLLYYFASHSIKKSWLS